jgi:hypothetical protein
MLSLGGRASAHAHPRGAPARHALITCGSYWLLPISTERQRSMPSSRFHAISLPLLRYRDLGMPSHGCCAVAHARPEGVPARHALVAGVARSVMLTQSGRWRGWLFRVPRAISIPPRGPNRRLQSTPLAASEIAPILRAGFCYNVITIYQCGAAEAQLVGPRGVVSSLIACLGGNVHAACSVSAAAPARMPTQAHRRRSMPPSLATRSRSCPSQRSASTACPYRSFRVNSLPLSQYGDLGMLSRGCCAVAHAHPVEAPASHAQVASVTLSIMLTLLGRWRGWLSHVPRALSYPRAGPTSPSSRRRFASTRSRRF